ncbi:hypothetical protein GB931_10850 [Modestobacter sp. I12A-02628]|uniref:Uncharacterized protein n=1 Tax=Goekera deserti TaxID=2497753 RepID=A0A7K3WBY8_9ACTN|nr:hypothetical protein [Goekera deserti]MPQ98405.1 hypothetical protein [Goekera deserti]NDI48232.1 hypothetical protein [Goekera deserti]NEL53981.1 hypothetical protein [Goekera deserti]
MTRAVGRPAVRLGVLLLAVLAVLALAGPASAHVGGGAAGSDYDGRVTSVSPEVPGLRVRALQFGDQLEVVTSGRDVEVPGYSGEPYLRIGPDGVWRNTRSPATYLNLDAEGRTPLPPQADPDAPPEWEQVSTAATYVWHDHRTHWMSSELPPQVRADPTAEHTVIDWTVPMTVDGAPVTVAGRLTWEPPPPGWLVWPLYAALALAGVLAGARARTPRPLGLVLLAGGVASVVHAAGTPEPAVSVSSWPGALAGALLPALVVLAVAVLGWRASRRGRGVMTGLLAVVVGWLMLVQGIPDVDALWTANLLGTTPAAVTRAAVAVLVGLGLGSVMGGVLAVRRFRDPAQPVVAAAGAPPTT